MGWGLFELNMAKIVHPKLSLIITVIPSIRNLSKLTAHPEFAEAFLAASWLIEMIIVLRLFVFVRGYHLGTYATKSERRTAILKLSVLVFLGILTAWFLPYAPIETYAGRASIVLEFSTSGVTGILFGLNFVVATASLSMFLILYTILYCTDSAIDN
jgi:hypothetical protein